MIASPAAPRPRRPRKRNPWPRVVAGVALALLLFLVGVALGMALQERPVPGGKETIVRTLEPVTLQTSP
jgi:hypothetical protein